jgi:hypothetical protein
MKQFIEGQNRAQSILLPECLDDFVDEDSPVRVIDAFVDELDLARLGVYLPRCDADRNQEPPPSADKPCWNEPPQSSARESRAILPPCTPANQIEELARSTWITVFHFRERL